MNPGDPDPKETVPGGAFELLDRLMAEELHDTVCQSLAGMAFLVSGLRKQAESGAAVPADGLETVARFLERAMGDLRAIVSPDSLAGAGLAQALERFVREVSADVPCRFSASAGPGVADARAARVLYRLARWAVRHAAKSAGPLLVALEQADEGLRLEVHGGGKAMLAEVPAETIDFLRRYAASAGVELAVDAGGLRAWVR